MIHFISRKQKDYSRHNILQLLLDELPTRHEIYLLLPFSKKRMWRLLGKRERLINDFFISDYDTWVNDRQKGSSWHPAAWYKWLLDWLNFRFSRYLLADTQSHFEHWQRLFGRFRGRHLVFPVLADPRLYQPAAQPIINSVPIILFYGYFIPLHGVDVILRALALCERQGLSFQARLIGDGQTLGQMLALAKSLQLKQVWFSGKLIPEQELVHEIQQADLLLGIFGSSDKARSVVPNKLYQALACAKPIITQDSPAIHEFFCAEQLCLVQPTPEDLAGAISDLLGDVQARQELAEKGHERFQQMWQQHSRALQDFVKALDDSL